jgi:hypothetical protein
VYTKNGLFLFFGQLTSPLLHRKFIFLPNSSSFVYTMLSSIHLVLGALLLASTAVNAAPSLLEARQRQCLLLPCTPEPGECPRGTVGRIQRSCTVMKN